MKIGIAMERESIQSSIPPLPGITTPASFTPALLFSIDSKRSPQVPKIAVGRAIRNIFNGVVSSILGKINKRIVITKAIPTVPPIKPAIDLLGEHLTKPLLFLPKSIPLKYAIESEPKTIPRKTRIAFAFGYKKHSLMAYTIKRLG